MTSRWKHFGQSELRTECAPLQLGNNGPLVTVSEGITGHYRQLKFIIQFLFVGIQTFFMIVDKPLIQVVELWQWMCGTIHI